MSKRSNTFCIMPFIHLHNMSNGLFKMCCLTEIPLVDDFGRSYFVGNQSINEVWNSNCLKSARKLMLENNEVPLCKNCYKVEDSGGKSLRNEYNTQYSDKYNYITENAKNNNYEINEFPNFIELRTGNSCNSACRMCNSNDSSLVQIENSEIIKNLKINPFKTSETDHTQTIVPDPNIIIFGRPEEKIDNITYNIDAHIDEIIKNIKHIQTLTLSGGEPFLLERTTQLLETIALENPNLNLHINTNGSIASDRIQVALSKLNNVHLCISVDGYYKINEYIRYPLKWNKIENNISKFYNLRRNGFYISVNITVQAFNALNLDELIIFFLTNYPDIFVTLTPLSMPFHLSIQSLPDNIKKEITSVNKQLIHNLNQMYPSECINELIRTLYSMKSFMDQMPAQQVHFDMLKSNIKVYDRHRNQNIKDYIPKLAQYL